MRNGKQDGMQFFDGEIEKLIRDETISIDVRLLEEQRVASRAASNSGFSSTV
jgi:hypothetical protein